MHLAERCDEGGVLGTPLTEAVLQPIEPSEVGSRNHMVIFSGKFCREVNFDLKA
jgi:hypothetical protein